MKCLRLLWWMAVLVFNSCWVNAQSIEDHAEILASREEDNELQESEILKNITAVKIYINEVNRLELSSLEILDEKQLQSFFEYRQQFGSLLSPYELQAIPGWDLETIRKLLPLITFEQYTQPRLKSIFKKGSYRLLLRNGGALFRSIDSSFAGAGNRFLLKYQYTYHKKMRFGFLAEKDAGEKMNIRKLNVFDFYSWHLEWNDLNKYTRKIIAGDYTVNFGQGLIQWQGFGFGKGGAVTTVKKEGGVIDAYHGANEFNFHRGVAVMSRYKKMDISLFVSRRKLDGNIDGDSISSISTSGYHRTGSELQNKKSFALLSSGINLSYKNERGSVGLNSIFYKFDHVYSKRSLPYNLNSIRDDHWRNTSMDYSFTYKNLHAFGEIGIDKKYRSAFLAGIILSLHKFADLNIVYRRISPGYQSLFSRALTENTAVNNESGLYMNWSVKWKKFVFDFYGDQFFFPWVKFTIDAPSSGWEYGLQVKWTPSRNIELINRIRMDENDQQLIADYSTAEIFRNKKRSFRSHLNFTINKEQVLKLRFETTAIKTSLNGIKYSGYLSYLEFQNRISSLNITVVTRFQYFDIDDFNSRIYVFERDVTYAMSVPFFSNKGIRYYFTVQGKPASAVVRRLLKGSTINLSFKWSQTKFFSDENSHSLKSDFNIQIIYSGRGKE